METASGGFWPRLLEKSGFDVSTLRAALKAKIGTLPKQVPPPDHVSPDSKLMTVLKTADALRKKNEDSHIAIDHMVQGLFQDATLGKLFSDAGLATDKLLETIKEMRGTKKVTSEGAESSFEALSKYAVDLVSRAELGKIDPVIGRDDEIRRVIRVLSRRTKNNPVLAGECCAVWRLWARNLVHDAA